MNQGDFVSYKPTIQTFSTHVLSIGTDRFLTGLCTYQVNFFLQLVHILVSFAFLAFLFPAIWRCRQFVLFFPSLIKRKGNILSFCITPSTCERLPLLLRLYERQTVSALLFKHAVKLVLIIVRKNAQNSHKTLKSLTSSKKVRLKALQAIHNCQA